MSISNIQSNGLKPGVCLSTNRPAVPYEGQLIYETDTDLVLVWDGSAWDPIATTSLVASSGFLRFQTSWTLASFVSGWQDYEVNGWGRASYYRTNDGIVHLRGLVRRVSGSSNTMFTLPVGYRPPNAVMFATAAAGGVARIDVGSGGDVLFAGAQAGTPNIADWVSISEVKFGIF